DKQAAQQSWGGEELWEEERWKERVGGGGDGGGGVGEEGGEDGGVWGSASQQNACCFFLVFQPRYPPPKHPLSGRKNHVGVEVLAGFGGGLGWRLGQKTTRDIIGRAGRARNTA
ncbi:hypothetical protein ACTHT5_11595, partial [Neisseria sp. P0022.S002]|uniref:hypothetical protein n=1 Tax=Neisseria sp. P0022.S002 TaxID=3436827 RepID=UPI003F7FE7D5